ncbi:Transcription factor TFIIIB component B [Quillaja saponaria]|uniref:Transcription factor TFIIIB component B n=1 Tax=Quillaja saponaria TaxID=32244 RepID=A0AAD7M1E4_QUISA|nr:Transcription factor TFIIIB component B [Quillaja saponaria]KAJ7967291.1 Transcription factor TFIIIB component B [Quillaja saponaria]
MDPFDDILPEPPVARARAGGRFLPKAKSKPLPRKEISTSEQASLCNDGKDKASTSSSTGMGATQSVKIVENEDNKSTHPDGLSSAVSSGELLKISDHPSFGLPNLDGTPNSEQVNPSSQPNAKGDDKRMVDGLLSTTDVSDINGDWTSTIFRKLANEANTVRIDMGPIDEITPKDNASDGAPENVIGGETPYELCGASNFEGNRSLESFGSLSHISDDLGSKDDSYLEVTVLERNPHSDSSFGRTREVNPVEIEPDPFGHIFLEPPRTNARAGGKFQSKIKPRPRGGGGAAAVAVASASPNISPAVLTPMAPDEVQSLKSNDGHSSRLTKPDGYSLATFENLESTDPSNNTDYNHSSVPFSDDNISLGPVNPSHPVVSTALPPNIAVHNETGEWSSSFGKSAGESADIFSELECLGDFLTQPRSGTGEPENHAYDNKTTEENFVIPACSSVDSSIFGVCDAAQIQTCHDYHTTQDSATIKEPTVFNFQTDNGSSEIEEVEGTNPSLPPDDTHAYPSVSIVDIIPSSPTPEIQVHVDLTNNADVPSHGDVLSEDVYVDASIMERVSTRSSPPRKHKKSPITGEVDKGGKSLRQPRKWVACELVNDPNNEADDDCSLSVYSPSNSIGDEHEENDDECRVVNSSKKQKTPNSLKKPMAENGKPAQKRKKSNEAQGKSTNERPKKFSHSTRRNKRCVDKVLLETPEDEIDPRTLRIKDIILLAEHRERLAKKEATTSKTPVTNQSDRNSFHDADDYNEFDETFASEDGRGSDHEYQADETVPLASSLFNYQSFMDKSPVVKWSKQDTELFYEAIQQFGTDFSMIQHLFPGRTRHHIKSKYKKEERQHPLRLTEAVNSRAKDHSHFKLVIEQLQQASGKKEENTNRDASGGMIDEEEVDLAPEANEEVPKYEHGEAIVKDQEGEVAEVQSPEKSDSDDDFNRWCNYRSEY